MAASPPHHSPHPSAAGLPEQLLLVLIFIFLVYPIWHYVIRFAYGLDQVFFPEIIDQNVTQPIFIIGNFRSGTTLLHRLLAKDQRFTGMKTWEIYLAPSIVQRKCLYELMKINHQIDNPLQTLIDHFEKALQAYSYMHKTGLNEIEEDSHVMLQIWSTYDLFAFFPFPELIKNYVTAQAALLLTGGGSGVAASPPHHSPLFPRTLSSYKITSIMMNRFQKNNKRWI